MAEQIEQLMRQVKLGGMAKGWRSVPYENTEQYVTDLLTLELSPSRKNGHENSGKSGMNL